MCTVAIVGLASGGYLLGHNRDESIHRGRALPPSISLDGSRSYLAPTDSDAGGTWIAVNDLGVTVCMLNAADVAPERLPVRPESRGCLARELADCGSLDEVRERFDSWSDRLETVRAFHVVAVIANEPECPGNAEWHRWDGRTHRVDRVQPPSLFVSALLDQSGAERERGRSWARLLDGREQVSELELAGWLAGHEPEAGMLSTCVHREDARTVSRTLVRVEPDADVVMRYLDGPPCDPRSRETTHRLERDRPPDARDQRRYV